MMECIHQLLPAMAGVMGVATVWADGGYLPHAGPPALRFRDPPPPIVKQVDTASFPPPFLPPFFPPPTLVSLQRPPLPSRPPDAGKSTNDAILPGVATNGAALEFDAREPILDPGSPMSPESIVSPQMLLKYFTNSANASPSMATNATSLRVVAPLGFNPPPVAPAAPTPLPPSKPAHSTPP
jgi:hypothetical protein